MDSKNSSSNPNTGANKKIGSYRWSVCALLFFATTIIYVDRQALGILAPVLQKDIGWNEIQYGYIVAAFTAAYAIGLLIAGPLSTASGRRSAISSPSSYGALLRWGMHSRHRFGFAVARFSWAGRIRQLSGRDQSDRRMVPEKGTGIRNGCSTRA